MVTRIIIATLIACFLSVDAYSQGERGSVKSGKATFNRKVKRGRGKPPGARTSKPLKKRRKSKRHAYGSKISRKQYKRGGVYFKARNSTTRGLGGNFSFRDKSRRKRKKSALFEYKRKKDRYGRGSNFAKRYRKNKNFKKNNFGRTAKRNRKRIKRRGALFNARKYKKQNSGKYSAGDGWNPRRRDRIKKKKRYRTGGLFNKQERQRRKINRKRRRQRRNADFSYSPRDIAKQRRKARKRRERGIFPRSVKPY